MSTESLTHRHSMSYIAPRALCVPVRSIVRLIVRSIVRFFDAYPMVYNM